MLRFPVLSFLLPLLWYIAYLVAGFETVVVCLLALILAAQVLGSDS